MKNRFKMEFGADFDEYMERDEYEAQDLNMEMERNAETARTSNQEAIKQELKDEV